MALLIRLTSSIRLSLITPVAVCILAAIPAPGRCEPAGSPDRFATDIEVHKALENLPLYFIENRGQVDERVAYYLEGSSRSVYFTRQGVVFVLRGPEGERRALELEFLDANPGVTPEGREPTEAVFSYFKGPRDKWKTGLRTFHSVVYPDLWPGIDLIYSGEVNRMKYRFVVHPGADPSLIRWTYRGADKVAINRSGALKVHTPVDVLTDETPYAYQEAGQGHREVATSFALTPAGEGTIPVVGFRVGHYARNLTLVIDPEVYVYAGFIGGPDKEKGFSIAVDGDHKAYVTGETSSGESSFPVTVGPDLTYGGGKDGFVCKVNAAGDDLDYCGYIGGESQDIGRGIAVDGSGHAYVSGETESDEDSFPVTVGPDLTYGGGKDAFVCKVNLAGDDLDYCGYIGGDSQETGPGISLDGSDNAYVTGPTKSDEGTFPVTVGPDLTQNGGEDAFTCQVDSSGTFFGYCGFIGGDNDDLGFGVAADSAGNAYVVGQADSDEGSFPDGDGFGSLTGPDVTHNGNEDGFVCRVNPGGETLGYCGYIGGSGRDLAFGVAFDADGNTYVTGETSSEDLPTITGPDLTHNGSEDAFVLKIMEKETTSIDLVDFLATRTAGGQVALRWQSGFEADNLGYNVYAERRGEKIRLNPGIIGGSALLAGARTPLTAGNSYVWGDLLPSVDGSTHYWLEAVDLKGRSTWHGPILAGLTADDIRVRPGGRSRLLRHLGRVKKETRLTSNAWRITAPPGAASTENLGRQWDLAAGTALKILVSEEGWYRLGQTDLVAAGLDPGIDPRSLRLFVDGQEAALMVTGGRDGRFDAVDSIQFYGVGLDSSSSVERV